MRYLLFLCLTASTVFLFAQPRVAYVHGKIYTVDEKRPWAEAVVAQGGKIIFVGGNAEAKKWINANTTTVDLKGKLTLPGFIDDHTHFISGGFYLLGVDLRHARSTKEFIQIIRDYAAQHKGEWIQGGDWDHEAWEIKDLPTKEMIDSVTPGTPVFINRFDGHMSLANSYAMKLAGVDRATVSPPGGIIVKDLKTGEPTGIFKDDATDLINRAIPDPSPAQYKAAALRALQEAREQGFTGIQDITLPKDLAIYQVLEKEHKLTCRVYTRLPIADYKNLVNLGIQAGFGSDRLKIGSLKGFADGSLGSSTALFFEPYDQDKTTRGIALGDMNNGNIRKWAFEADSAHLQISIHAIGDSANYLILNLFEDIIKKNPAWDRRFRIEHAQHVRFEDIPRFARLHVIASVQPYHAIDDGVWAEKRIGKRIKYTYSFKSLMQSGATVCFGSDWSVAPLNAILGIYAAVTRRTLDGKNPGGWLPEQKVGVAEAIKAYTLNNAYAAFEENVKGSIEVGKLADLVVLSDNIFEIDPVKIKDVHIVGTILDGAIIYERPKR